MSFSGECTMQQFVPRHIRHMHIRRPLGKRVDKKNVVATVKHPPSPMSLGVMSCRGVVGQYFIPPNTTMYGHKYVELLKEKLHDVHARWRSLSPIKGSYRGPGEKQDVCVGIAWEQPRSQSSREPVDC